jgi:hypothetical protein
VKKVIPEFRYRTIAIIDDLIHYFISRSVPVFFCGSESNIYFTNNGVLRRFTLLLERFMFASLIRLLRSLGNVASLLLLPFPPVGKPSL